MKSMVETQVRLETLKFIIESTSFKKQEDLDMILTMVQELEWVLEIPEERIN
ncbi:hypothetical protein LCGC14_0534720 [marine sediment metagenome]|uniref:Uncharacterized protein n=1 Tax=marine sediment metagenome TaxID=412755 RepID=A0A0F9UG15_9ZZZZ